MSPQFFARLPPALTPLLHSGILLAALSAVLLNLIFNGVQGERAVMRDMRRVGHDLEPHADDRQQRQ